MATGLDETVTQPGAVEVPGIDASGERATLGLVSIGHFFSHYYGLVLPPLFPFLKVEFGVSYLQLGLVMTAYSLLGGVAQSPVGFLVDRVGPARVLLAGLGLNAVAILLMGFVDSYWLLIVLAFVAGLGNSVFHPADYAILNGRVREEKLGRAFSIHTFSGFFGGACAPVSILVIAQWTGWRTALILVGVAGVSSLLLLYLRRELLTDGRTARTADQAPGGPPSGLRLLLTLPVLLFGLFFILYGMCSGGLIAFMVAALVDLHGMSLADANTALSGHLFGVVAGILLAGVVVDRVPRHLLTVGVALGLAALASVAAVWSAISAPGLIALMVITGVGLGAVLPARDLMLRALTPPGQIGKVFGFVFVGYSIGLGAAPVLFGWFLDQGLPALVFVFAGVFALLALAASATARNAAPSR